MNGADGGCAACPNAAAVAEIPPAMTGTPLVLKGGIAGWVALRSDQTFTNVTLEAEWETKITAGTLLVRMNGCRVKGDKPDSTVVNRVRGACSVEEVVQRSQVWNIEDVGNDDDFTMHTLYEYFRANYACYMWAFITCDYRLYGFIPSTGNAGTLMPAVAHFVDDNIPQTQDDDAILKMNVTTRIDGLIIPISLPFLPNLAAFIN